MRLERAAHEQRCQVAALQERVGTGDVNVVLFPSVQAVHSLFKRRAHLDLVDHHVVVHAGLVPFFDVAFQRVILKERFVIGQVEIDVDHVGTIVIGLYARDERLQQFRLAASAHACDDFDVGRASNTFQLVKVSGSLDQLHRFSPR